MPLHVDAPQTCLKPPQWLTPLVIPLVLMGVTSDVVPSGGLAHRELAIITNATAPIGVHARAACPLTFALIPREPARDLA